LSIAERPALSVECNNNRLFAWCAITTVLGSAALLERHVDGDHRRETFFSLFYKVDGIKSGMHHPDGLLWIRRSTKEHRVFESHVDLDLVAPMLLAELGLPPAAWMRRSGLSQFSFPDAPAGRRAVRTLAETV